MADGTDEFEKVVLSAGENDFSFIGEAYNTEFYTNPFVWGAAGGEPVILPFQRIFEGTLRSAQSGVLLMEAGADGILRNVYLHNRGAFGGFWYFNVRHNGVGLWTGANRLTLSPITPADEKQGLNIAVEKGDSLVLDLEQKGLGSTFGPLIWIVDIETQ